MYFPVKTLVIIPINYRVFKHFVAFILMIKVRVNIMTRIILIIALLAAPFVVRIAREVGWTSASTNVGKVEKESTETIITAPVKFLTDPQDLIILEPLRKLIDGN